MTNQNTPIEQQTNRENDWTKRICRMLNAFLKSYDLYAKTRQKIPYSQEIDGYSDDGAPIYMDPDCFETDLMIYELKDGVKKPRVIVEAKYTSITTHDAITYSSKAAMHKTITPYLRYGIMIGASDRKALPGRLFHHGTNFDFMFSFVGEEPSKNEWETYTDMILKEVEYSRTMEFILHEKKRNKNKYFMLQKQLVLAEQENDKGKKNKR